MRILYVATSSFPGDNAYSTRIYGLCKSLQLAGIETDVLTDYSNCNVGKFVFSGCNVIAGAKHLYQNRTLTDKILTYPRMIKQLQGLIKTREYDCIIMSSIYMRVNTILRIARKNRIPIVLESCEWFEAYNWRKQEKSLEYKKYINAWNQSFIKADGVIVISRLLEQHYKKYVKNVIRIPTVMSIPEENLNKHSGKPIKLIFSGSIAWGKDRLFEIIQAIDELDEEGLKIELNIFGPSEESIIKQLGNANMLNRHKDLIIVHGMVPHDEICLRCAEADFGILLRPNRKQSNAGFPTKLAEYMSVGTSVIANDTGDIGLYINDSVNGFLLPTDFSIDELKETLRRIIAMNQSDIDNIKMKAYETAKLSFDCAEYVLDLKDFLDRVVNTANYQALY